MLSWAVGPQTAIHPVPLFTGRVVHPPTDLVLEQGVAEVLDGVGRVPLLHLDAQDVAVIEDRAGRGGEEPEPPEHGDHRPDPRHVDLYVLTCHRPVRENAPSQPIERAGGGVRLCYLSCLVVDQILGLLIAGPLVLYYFVRAFFIFLRLVSPPSDDGPGFTSRGVFYQVRSKPSGEGWRIPPRVDL